MINIKDNLKILLMLFLNYVKGSEKDNSMIYILTWATSHLTPAPDSEKGQLYFINKRCLFQNCFLTNNQSYFNDIRQFDAILFHAVSVHEPELALPATRLESQKYIFMSNEPSVLYPIKTHYNGFFNYTFTYILHSDMTWRFFIVKDKEGKVIAPKHDVNWIDVKDMKSTSNKIVQKLQNKSKAAAWFVSHCETPSQREVFVRKFNEELKDYKLTVDTFGDCGNLGCTNEQCPILVENDYYFYLVFENSMCRDYVTEKVLVATKHFAVPIVYGGANYSRFLPPESYLDANALGPRELARIINDTIYDKKKYYDFFKWHRYYSFHPHSESAETDEICALCTYLNDNKHDYVKSVYTRITEFWLPQ